MPLIRITSSFEIEKEQQEKLLRDLIDIISSITGKPKKFIVAIFQKASFMISGESTEKSLFLEIKSIGALNPENTNKISKEICGYFEKNFNITPDRINIEFRDVERTMWGWNGKTFA